MKIFGIGLSKTGTSSLAQALAILGFRTKDYPGVAQYIPGDLSTLDPAMLDGHDALTDTPIPSLYPALDARYPGAKFILTVRSMDGWLKSCKKQFTEKHAANLNAGHHQLFTDLYGLGKPTIAKVRGYCLAGGFGLALACDLVIASTDSQFGTPEINVGLWPYMITVPLCRSMPPKKALELMMTGRRIDAAEADALGLLSRLVEPDELDAAVAETAATLASKSPSVMRSGRDSFYGVWDLAAADALRTLHPLLTLNTSFEDAAEGITAFLEKREPHWTGR